MSDPDDPGFSARRAAARQVLNAIDAVGGQDAHRRGWFTAVYDLASGDPAKVPWADLAPHPLLAAWLPGEQAAQTRLRALDIGCGLGDNAQALAEAGYATTAFDLVPAAIAWARRRFPSSPVDYRVADLFAPPTEWDGAFDLVHECYTLQALSEPSRGQAQQAIARFIAPGGRLLVIARSRDEDEPAKGPPWPLSRADLARFGACGLIAEAIERISDPSDGRPHWRAVFTRAV